MTRAARYYQSHVICETHEQHESDHITESETQDGYDSYDSASRKLQELKPFSRRLRLLPSNSPTFALLP